MPQKSDRLQFLQDLDLMLITSLSYVKKNELKLTSHQMVAGCNSVFFLSIFILAHLKTSPDINVLLSHFNWLISTRHLQKSRSIALKYHYVKLKNWRCTSASVMEAIDLVLKHRYLQSRSLRPRVATLSHTIDVILQNNSVYFQRWARMDHASFAFVCDQIRDHPVFFNDSYHSQAPVECQLLVALAHLGLNGNGGSPHILAHVFNISEGSVENYTNRCLRALVDLEPLYVRWPSREERTEYCAGNTESTVFTKCVGLVDGTIIPLTFAPSCHKEDYWMRKMVYGLNSLIVCNRDRRVIYSLHGWCGSAHNQRVLKYTKLHTSPSSFFSPGEFLLADSGYTASDTVIPAFKRVRGRTLTADKQAFNTHLSHLRVEVEHCIGMIKNRWQSLKNLRLKLKDKRSGQRLVIWMRVCIILHNLLLEEEDSFDPLSTEPMPQGSRRIDEDDEEQTEGENTAHRDILFNLFVDRYLS